jgi:hypothetical protein
MRHAYLGLCIALALTTIGPAAHAQSTDTNARSLAEQHFKAGEKLQTEGNDQQALIEYRQAYGLYPTTNTLYNIAVAEQHTGDLLKARDDLLACLKDERFRYADLARKHLGEIHAQLGHLHVQAPAGTTITIDGQPVADWSQPLDVVPGTHAVMATHGWQATHTVQAVAGQEVVVSFVEPPAQGAGQQGVGVSQPAAAAMADPSPPKVEGPAAPPIHDSGSPPRGEGFWTPRREVGVAVAAAGLLSLGAGGYFFAQASDQQSRVQSLSSGLSGSACAAAHPPAACGELDDARTAQQRDAVLSDVLLGVGAAAVVGGALLVLWPTAHDASAGAAVEPLFLPGVAGLQLRGEMP